MKSVCYALYIALACAWYRGTSVHVLFGFLDSWSTNIVQFAEVEFWDYSLFLLNTVNIKIMFFWLGTALPEALFL